MQKGLKATNYWMGNKVKINNKYNAQSYLKPSKKTKPKQMSMGCSCNCYGDCSGGDCTSCSECG